jgi:hypothetical protein
MILYDILLVFLGGLMYVCKVLGGGAHPLIKTP